MTSTEKGMMGIFVGFMVTDTILNLIHNKRMKKVLEEVENQAVYIAKDEKRKNKWNFIPVSIPDGYKMVINEEEP